MKFTFFQDGGRPPFWNKVEIEKSGSERLWALVCSIYMPSFMKIAWKLWPVKQKMKSVHNKMSES